MVKEVLAQPILTTGEYVDRVERMLADYLGVPHCLCVMSCTGALHMSLLALGIGPGDEVITTPMTFIATATSILEAGATPVFVDVEPDTGQSRCHQVEAAITPRTKAIIPVHLYRPDVRHARACARLPTGTVWRSSRMPRTASRACATACVPADLGDTACFSFYATKNLTCGEGGAVSRAIRALRKASPAARPRHDQDRRRPRARGLHPLGHGQIGWKCNMSDIEAALLLPQFARLDAKLVAREALARRYAERLAGVPGIRVPTQSTGANDVHARHLFPIWVGDGRRDEVVAELKQRRVEVVVNYRAIHLLSYFRDTFGFKPGDFPVAEEIGNAAISLPFFPGMSVQDVDTVVDHLHTILEGPRRAAG